MAKACVGRDEVLTMAQRKYTVLRPQQVRLLASTRMKKGKECKAK